MDNEQSKEKEYVDYFYEKYSGRVSLGVGYNQDLTEIYPFVFEADGKPIGIVALGVLSAESKIVNIYHIGSFKTKRGDGHKILKELCFYADQYKISLSVSAVFMPNGKDKAMDSNKLQKWYEGFDFIGENGLLRKPQE
ncbi:MAG: hypothetical protein GY714_11600 [Desulfobacterales bacterium]|nr:hypothetical protein [Desulfobacterales bacterium]MCP4161828.1 hypothetical protein [Deltaproteobacteria bacterium]